MFVPMCRPCETQYWCVCTPHLRGPAIAAAVLVHVHSPTAAAFLWLVAARSAALGARGIEPPGAPPNPRTGLRSPVIASAQPSQRFWACTLNRHRRRLTDLLPMPQPRGRGLSAVASTHGTRTYCRRLGYPRILVVAVLVRVHSPTATVLPPMKPPYCCVCTLQRRQRGRGR